MDVRPSFQQTLIEGLRWTVFFQVVTHSVGSVYVLCSCDLGVTLDSQTLSIDAFVRHCCLKQSDSFSELSGCRIVKAWVQPLAQAVPPVHA